MKVVIEGCIHWLDDLLYYLLNVVVYIPNRDQPRGKDPRSS